MIVISQFSKYIFSADTMLNVVISIGLIILRLSTMNWHIYNCSKIACWTSSSSFQLFVWFVFVWCMRITTKRCIRRQSQQLVEFVSLINERKQLLPETLWYFNFYIRLSNKMGNIACRKNMEGMVHFRFYGIYDHCDQNDEKEAFSSDTIFFIFQEFISYNWI